MSSGWVPVEREVYIDHDLENNPLWIRTHSELGSGEDVLVRFYDSNGELAGGIAIRFNNTLEYWLGLCSSSWKVFPTTPPATRDKVWKIIFDKTAGIRVIIHCNGVEVLNVPVSYDECEWGGWNIYWSRSVEWIKFLSEDSASDYYQLENPYGK